MYSRNGRPGGVEHAVADERFRYEQHDSHREACRDELCRKGDTEHATHDEQKAENDGSFIGVSVCEADGQNRGREARPIEHCHALHHRVLSADWQEEVTPGKAPLRGIVLAGGATI